MGGMGKSNVLVVDDKLMARSAKQVMIIKHLKTMVLNKSNCHAWRARYAANLHGNKLMRFVEGKVDLKVPHQ